MLNSINTCKVNVVFLKETKLQSSKSEGFKHFCGNHLGGFIFSPSNGASGGLISMWKHEFFSLDRHMVFDRTIVLVGTLSSLNQKYGLVNIYAPNDLVERGVFFEFLTKILSSLQISIIVGGDFNTVKCGEEKVGGSANKRSEPCITVCVLDRCLFSPAVLSWFPNLSQSALQRKLSDHNAISLRDNGVKRGIGAKLRDAESTTKSWVATIKANDTLSIEALENKMSLLEQLLKSENMGNGDTENLK
ncbi:hypothetical protein V6N13_051153 [Hibiscus sabdariffa]